MIFRFLIKTAIPVAAGSILVGWTSLGGTPAAKTLKAEAHHATCAAPCKRSAGFVIASRTVPHTTATKKTITTKAIALSERHPSRH
jgi:hypothetical protein